MSGHVFCVFYQWILDIPHKAPNFNIPQYFIILIVNLKTLLGRPLSLCFSRVITKALNLSFSPRVCCPEPEGRARGPPAGELPCSRMWSLQESQSQTAARDSRPLWSTLTPSHPTPCSSSLPHSRETTGREHTGTSKFPDWHSFGVSKISASYCAFLKCLGGVDKLYVLVHTPASRFIFLITAIQNLLITRLNKFTSYLDHRSRPLL